MAKKSVSPPSPNQVQQYESDSSKDRDPLSGQIRNLISPNRQQQHQLSSPPPRISTCSSMLSGSESSGSYSSSSSAGCSSIETGAVNNQNDMLNTVGISNSKKKALLKSKFLDNEVGHGLLNNIHKMQSLLEEYQKSLTSLEFEKADKQNEIDILQKRLKARGETEERYKDEIWNLEYKNQELQQKLNDLNQNYQKSKLERKRLAHVENDLTQEFENLKATQQSWEKQLEEARENHEKEILSLKKLLHTSKVEKENLSKQIQDLTAVPQVITTNILHPVETITKEIETNEKGFKTKAAAVPFQSIDNTPLNNTAIIEVQGLKKSLDQAHEIIKTMQIKMDKERDERYEVDKLLREAQETIENYNVISQNNSTQWYPVNSPILSVGSNLFSNNDDQLFLPTSPSSLNSNHEQNTGQLSRKSTVGLYSGKSCRERSVANKSKSPHHTRVKPLFDELSLAGSSIGNFASSMADLNQEEITNLDNDVTPSSPALVMQEKVKSPSVTPFKDQQGVNQISQDNTPQKKIILQNEQSEVENKIILEEKYNNPIQEIHENHHLIQKIHGNQQTANSTPIIELDMVDLPSISNHEIFSSFSSNSSNTNSGEDDNYSEEMKVVIQQNKEHYGSLLRKPDSYIYKSRRELDEEIKKEMRASTSNIIASSRVENILNSKMELPNNIRRRESIDDKSVSALTRTMVGDWMWKYTRKVVGSGISENRHRRFFWIHPYTQTLYWSSEEPGTKSHQSNTKSVLVESLIVLDSDDKNESSTPSIFIKTASRGIKIQCMNIIAHNAWLKSLNFLLGNSKSENKTLPKLSSLGNVSKQHYLDRKMSIQKHSEKADSKPKVELSRDNSFKFITPVTVAIDDLMPPPSPTTFHM